MQKLVLKNFGPVRECEISVRDTMVLAGRQASGKSTVAKAIFFFKNIPNLLELQIRKRLLQADNTVEYDLIRAVRLNFLQTFGSTWCMDPTLEMEYHYSGDIGIRIFLRQGMENQNYIWIEMGETLSHRIKNLGQSYQNLILQEQAGNSGVLHTEIIRIFEDDREVVYIPAGRSVLTLLSNQLNYIYGVMDDVQKRDLDYCTQNYLEKTLKIRPFFSKDLDSIIRETKELTGEAADPHSLQLIRQDCRDILQGEYHYINGEERLQIQKDRYVKINFASSGQQEAVWILNMLLYQLLNRKKTFFIIEEPESHLFPDAQKDMIQFISMVQKYQNQVLITTHSPYVLGTLNNLLYAGEMSQTVPAEKINGIIDAMYWQYPDRFDGYYLENGRVCNCMDEEHRQIQNEIIDGASVQINADYDALLSVKYGEE